MSLIWYSMIQLPQLWHIFVWPNFLSLMTLDIANTLRPQVCHNIEGVNMCMNKGCEYKYNGVLLGRLRVKLSHLARCTDKDIIHEASETTEHNERSRWAHPLTYNLWYFSCILAQTELTKSLHSHFFSIWSPSPNIMPREFSCQELPVCNTWLHCTSCKRKKLLAVLMLHSWTRTKVNSKRLGNS